MRLLAAAALGILVSTSAAHASVVVTFSEVGNNVVAELTGAFDLGAFAIGRDDFTASAAGIDSGSALFSTGDGATTQTLYGGGVSGPSAFGTGGVSVADSRSGDAIFFGPQSDELFLPSAYVSGQALSATLTFLNKSFSDLGVIAGTQFDWDLPGANTFTIRFAEPAVIPLPAGLPLLLGALGLLAVVRRRPV